MKISHANMLTSSNDCCGSPWLRQFLPKHRASAFLEQHHEEQEEELQLVVNDQRDDHADPRVPSSPILLKTLIITREQEEEDCRQPCSLTVATHVDESFSESDDDDVDLLTVVPESPELLRYCPRILTAPMMEQLHARLPDSLQMNPWERCFAIGRDGDAFETLLRRCAVFTYSLLVIRTVRGHVLGGFAAQPWRLQDGYLKRRAYYGTGQSFVFGSHVETTSTTLPLSIYGWTGVNDYCQICNVDEQVLAMGGGGNHFGWTLHGNLEHGQTGYCGTFGNPPLVPGGLFEVADVEVYGLRSLSMR